MNNPGDRQANYAMINASRSSKIYKDDHNDVTPVNFNINLYVKV
ncbi:hypothetical protein [Helicobacter didelphidarum]|nr:hypothetical protein [Helicobacter didelphidarum]